MPEKRKMSDAFAQDIAKIESKEYQIKTQMDPILQRMVLHLTQPLELSSPEQIDFKARMNIPDTFTPFQKSLFPYLNAGSDLLFTHAQLETIPDIQQLYCMHALQHVYKKRDTISKHSAKIKLQVAENQSPR